MVIGHMYVVSSHITDCATVVILEFLDNANSQSNSPVSQDLVQLSDILIALDLVNLIGYLRYPEILQLILIWCTLRYMHTEYIG